MSKGITDNISRILLLLVIVVVILALAGASQSQIDLVVSIFSNVIVSALMSLVAATMIEAITGDALRVVLLTVEIWGFKFSFSLFIIATAILKLLIFR